MGLTNLAIKRGVTFTMLFIAIIGFGIVSLLRLNPELLPDVSFPVVLVSTTYSGAAPREVEKLVTRPIEEVASTVTNVKEINSTVREGQSLTLIKFEWGTDMDMAAFNVREKLDLIKEFLPEDVKEPFVFNFDPSIMPVMAIGLYSKERDQKEIKEIIENRLKPHLERIEGVARASVFGGLEREIQVNLEKSKLQAYGIPIQRIINTIGGSNLTLPGGDIEKGGKKYLIRTEGEFESVKEIEDVVVSYEDGVPVRVKDIGEVVDGTEDVTTIASIEGNPGVGLMINKRSGAVTVDVSKRVRERLKSLKYKLPEDIEFDIFLDQAEYINKSIGNLYNVAWQGAFFAIFILFLFLANLRTTTIIAAAIPTSIIATFSAMDAAGITINMISMGGLALAIGMLVDNAIVVLENTYRHMEEGKTRREAALIGTQEVSIPIIASTLTTVSVFLPVVFVPGMIGIMFRDMSLTVTISLLVSLFVALTFIPLLCSRFLKVAPSDKKNPRSFSEGGRSRSNFQLRQKRFFWRLDRGYERWLRFCLSHKKIFIFCTGALFFLSIFLIYPLRMVGTEFLPKQDQGMFQINVELPVSTTIENTEKVVKEVENIVRDNVAELEYVVSTIGGEEMEMAFGGGGGKSHFGMVYVGLVDLSERGRSQWEIMESLRPKLHNIPGAKITVKESGGMMGGGLMGGEEAPISIEIFGYDLETSENLAKKISGIIEKVKGTGEVETSLERAKPEFGVRINRDKAHSLGLSVWAIANTIGAGIQGKVAGLYREGGDEYNIRVRLAPADRSGLKELRDLPITTPLGSVIPLREVVEITPTTGPIKIERKEQERVVTVGSDYVGRDLGSVVREIESAIHKLPLPSDFFIKLGGEAKEQRESFKWLALALIGAVFLVYMVMASLFESLLHPFIIMLTFPLAVIGVIWLFFFTGTIFNVIAFLGVVVLSGIIVNNGIIMVHYIKLLRERDNLPLLDAVIVGARRRLRPVLMTALTTIFAMIPLAIGIGEGAEIRMGMARAVIGGLAVGTFLTLFVVPMIYVIMEKLGASKKSKIVSYRNFPG